jgi:hypothetical protein
MDNFFIVFPKNIDEALEKLVPVLTRREKTKIVNMSEKDLGLLRNTIGLFIQSEFKLWGNDPLINACKVFATENELSYDDPVMVIIWALWEKLQTTNLLKVVK